MLFSQFFKIPVVLVFLPGYSLSCSENEIEVECVNLCNTCEQKGRCDLSPSCQQGCDCKPGFFRDENGYCVPEQQCVAKAENSRCPKNALFLSCCPLVPPTCENPYPEPDSDYECVPGCACRSGFLKRRDGQCVTPDQCYPMEDHDKETPGMCREDEEYYECTPSCKNTCENIYIEGVKCRCGPPGCFCREGLVKTSEGKCIHPRNCPRSPSPNDPSPKCPKNAIFIKCGSPCPPTCDDLHPRPCEEKCTTACYCKPGYLKRKDGVCVRPIDCQPRNKQERPDPKCPENAIFIECGSPCPPTCDNRLPGPCEEKCIKACYCKPGFLLKTDKGKCVKPEQCNTSHVSDVVRCPENEEHSDCVVPCNDCKLKGRCQFFACNKGCDCKKGYFRDNNRKCILALECPQIMDPQPKCAADEQFYKCTPTCKNTCKNFNNHEEKCYCGSPGCFCREGLVKKEDGKCVPPDQCDNVVRCPENEEHSDCVVPCNDCKLKGRCQFFACNKGCDCKKGYFRDNNGKCSLASECPQIDVRCPENEEPSDCVVPCNDCKLKGRCQFFACNKGCDCKKGYFRDTNGKCILASECPQIISPQRECGPDQQFYNCTPSCKNTCKNFFNPAIRCGCRPPGCFCKDGLVRRDDGKCISPNQCQRMKPDVCPEKAEFSVCGPLCRPTCSDPYPAPCAKACVKGCFCKPGFVQDKDGKCVRLENCNKKCSRPNEEFQECGSTCPDTCENRGIHPQGSCPYRCVRGCFCKKGLYRTESGRCVPLKDCDNERQFTTTYKPTTTIENKDLLAVTVPGDGHGCPSRVECEGYCKSLGDFMGLCTGEGRSHCRCV